MMKILILICVISLTTSIAYSQNPFTGKLVYSVEMLDTNIQKIIDKREMVVYTNDTLSRIEVQNDALGDQVTIKHLELDKSYLMMTMMGKKLAIQTDGREDSTLAQPYEFKYKLFGRKKVNGFVLKKAIVFREDLEEKRKIWYFKDVRPEILGMYDGIKGLPADFYIGTIDGIVHYQIEFIEKQVVSKDKFGIPSDYEKIKLKDFMDHVRGAEN
ncbi:MAG: hypothetical protein QNL60_04985 [Flavobacteriales bacterium]